jgi:hypothetical protein
VVGHESWIVVVMKGGLELQGHFIIDVSVQDVFGDSAVIVEAAGHGEEKEVATKLKTYAKQLFLMVSVGIELEWGFVFLYFG